MTIRETVDGSPPELRPEDPILVVDDIADNRQLLERRLELRGYPVVCAASGQAALDFLTGHAVSVVLLDVMMPNLTGFDVLRELQQLDNDTIPPVIMLTARDAPDEIAQAMDLGASDYVTKPCDFRVLEARINAQLKRARNTGALRLRTSELEAHVENLHVRQQLDQLTGLRNVRAFEADLSRALAQARTRAEMHVLCVCTVDELQAINHTYGPAVGDAVLRTVSTILQGEVGDGETLARLRGDKFAVLFANARLDDARTRAQGMLYRLINQTVPTGEDPLAISVSVGLAPVSAEHSSVQTLIHSAEQASRLARAEGSNNIHVYQSGDQHLEDVRINTRWAMKLRQALREDQLVLYAQPILASGQEHAQPTRFEVLVRMIDEGRLVSPAEFLPAIEKHGLATDLDRWVVENTLNYLAALPDEVRARAERVSINLSGHSLDSQAFREFVIRRLRRATVPPQIICFEITETAAVVHMDGAVEFINALQDYGVTFALDDFGAGVSSFGYLRSLPVDCLKVDGQFVRHIDASPFDRGIVSAINEIAHAMGMETVAEFVENASLVQQLASIGVDYLQGHHIGAPQPLAFYLGVDDAMSRAAESSGR